MHMVFQYNQTKYHKMFYLIFHVQYIGTKKQIILTTKDLIISITYIIIVNSKSLFITNFNYNHLNTTPFKKGLSMIIPI